MIQTSPFNEMIIKIIKEQEGIIGPLAVEQAKKVNGLSVDWDHKQITINGNQKLIIDTLIKQYEKIFGQASIHVCKEIASSYLDKLTKAEIPTILQ